MRAVWAHLLQGDMWSGSAQLDPAGRSMYLGPVRASHAHWPGSMTCQPCSSAAEAHQSIQVAIVDIAAIKLNNIPELFHECVAGSLNAQHIDDLNDVVAGGVPRVHSWLAKHLQEQSASLPKSCRFDTGPHQAGTQAFGEPELPGKACQDAGQPAWSSQTDLHKLYEEGLDRELEAQQGKRRSKMHTATQPLTMIRHRQRPQKAIALTPARLTPSVSSTH